MKLASLESQNKTKDLGLSFKGETTSQDQDYKSDKTIEALTPDYTVVYKTGQEKKIVYTEFERTAKSKGVKRNN